MRVKEHAVLWLLTDGQTYEIVWHPEPGRGGAFVARTGAMDLDPSGAAAWNDLETEGHPTLLGLVSSLDPEQWERMRPWRPSPFFAEDLLMLADAAMARVRPLGIRVRRAQSSPWEAFRQEVLHTLRRTALRTG